MYIPSDSLIEPCRRDSQQYTPQTRDLYLEHCLHIILSLELLGIEDYQHEGHQLMVDNTAPVVVLRRRFLQSPSFWIWLSAGREPVAEWVEREMIWAQLSY